MNNYIYDILIELTPTKKELNDEQLLFVWEDLIASDKSKLEKQCHKIINKINQEWDDVYYDNQLKSDSKSLIIFNKKLKSESDKQIKIQTNDKNSKSFNPYFNDYTLLIVISRPNLWVFPTLTVRKKGKWHVYSTDYTSVERQSEHRRVFLDYTNENLNLFPILNSMEEIAQIGKESSADVPLNLFEWAIKLSVEKRIENNKLTENDLKILNSIKKIRQKTE